MRHLYAEIGRKNELRFGEGDEKKSRPVCLSSSRHCDSDNLDLNVTQLDMLSASIPVAYGVDTLRR